MPKTLPWSATSAPPRRYNDFLVDWVEAERAVGRFGLLMTATERDDFFDRLDAFVSASGGDSAQR